MNRLFSTLLLFVLCFAFAVPPTGVTRAAAPAWNSTTHYIVFEMDARGITPYSYRQVELAAPLESLSLSRLLSETQRLAPDRQPLILRLRAADGSLVYQSVIHVSTQLRGEFHGRQPGDPIDGHFFTVEKTSFVARVPEIPGTTLTIQNSAFKQLASFELAQLAAATPDRAVSQGKGTVTPIQVTGLANNRVDVVIMGDGYTAAQQTNFNTDANNIFSAFFGLVPMNVYANYSNVVSIFTPSNQPGADHPPYDASCSPYTSPMTCCADTAMLSDPLKGQMVDTAFDSSYCLWNIHRLLYTQNTSAVYAEAASYPDWDTILVIVNDPTYGGGGGGFAVFSMHSLAVQIAQHEYGHSFAWLDDEYDYNPPPPSTCDDTNADTWDDCAANVTNATTLGTIKWAPWIQPGTPIPTPEDGSWIGFVGLFQGAAYDPTNHYRSGDWCLMRSLGFPYCQVPGQAYVLRHYQGGWGTPNNGIELIEPGSQLPPVSTLYLIHPATFAFAAAVLSPAGGQPTTISWEVNGVIVPGAVNPVFVYNTSAAQLGWNTITMRAVDNNMYIHPAMAGGENQSSFTWNVFVGLPVYIPFIIR